MNRRLPIIAATIAALALLFIGETELIGAKVVNSREANALHGEETRITVKTNRLVSQQVTPYKGTVQTGRLSADDFTRHLKNELAYLGNTLTEARLLSDKFMRHQSQLANLNSQRPTFTDVSQEMQLKLQDAMTKQNQLMQMLSSILKSLHDTQKALINNMR